MRLLIQVAAVAVLVSAGILRAAHAAGPDPRVVELRQKVHDQKCALGDCWAEMFDTIHQAIEGSEKALKEYAAEFNRRMKVAKIRDRTDESSEQTALEYQLALIEQYLAECDDLKAGPDVPRHIILAGHHFIEDGQNNRMVALSMREEALERYCGEPSDTPEYAACARRIVLKEDVSKDDLYRYLGFLGKHSVQSFQYAGHGFEQGLTLGKKDLLLPVDWDRGVKGMSYDEWKFKNSANFYETDLIENPVNGRNFGALLAHVMAPGAEVNLYACNAGKSVARKLAWVLNPPAGGEGGSGGERENTNVSACLSSMHFEYQDDSGRWRTDWRNPVPLDAKKARLVPDRGPGEWQKPEPEEPVPLVLVDDSPPKRPRYEVAARDVLLKLAINGAQVAVVNGGTRAIFFNREEAEEVHALLKPYMGHLSFKEEHDYLFYRKLMDRKERRATTAEERRFWQRLGRKVDDCVWEAHRLYR